MVPTLHYLNIYLFQKLVERYGVFNLFSTKIEITDTVQVLKKWTKQTLQSQSYETILTEVYLNIYHNKMHNINNVFFIEDENTYTAYIRYNCDTKNINLGINNILKNIGYEI